jgi:hypothetical protein
MTTISICIYVKCVYIYKPYVDYNVIYMLLRTTYWMFFFFLMFSFILNWMCTALLANWNSILIKIFVSNKC